MLPKPFSPAEFRVLLDAVLESGYQPVGFPDFDGGSDRRQVIIRHDVDFIPELALALARIEAELGIASTFFFLPRSHVYNLFSERTSNVVGQIHDLGHTVALHCSLPHDLPLTAELLEARVQDDFRIGRLAFPEMAPIFAWHTLPPDVFEAWRGFEVRGFTNAYADRFFSDIVFRSDSNGARRPEDLLRTVSGETPAALQLLLHPIIWMCGGTDMVDVLTRSWKYFIRNAEVELSTNSTYQERLPSGLSDQSIQEFAASFEKACRT